MELTEIRRKADALLGKYRHLRDEVRRAKAEAVSASAAQLAAEEARVVIQSVAQTVQRAAHGRVAAVVSRCLDVVRPWDPDGDPYRFDVEFVQRRGKTECDLSFLKGEYRQDPTDGGAGGVLDVTAFALRVHEVLATRPPLRRLLLLDEPFKHLGSGDHDVRLQALLDNLATDLGFQIVIFTQNRGLRAGKVIELD